MEETKACLDSCGRISIPMQMLASIGTMESDSFYVRKSGPRKLELELIPQNFCIFCNIEENLFQTSRGYICEDCIIDLFQSVIRKEKNLAEEKTDHLSHKKK